MYGIRRVYGDSCESQAVDDLIFVMPAEAKARQAEMWRKWRKWDLKHCSRCRKQ
jgi:hypothetical protein